MAEPGRLRVAVVGAGFGGLAAAIRLQAAGVQTVLFEARLEPGGRAYVYRDRGFTFDAGPTVLTAPHCLEELYEVAGRRLEDAVELIPIHPFYRLLWADGTRLDYDGDAQKLLAEIARLSPSDVDGYHRFYDLQRDRFCVCAIWSESRRRSRACARIGPSIAPSRATCAMTGSARRSASTRC
jgi:phytoene desaturase